jgi:hypothetical protein
MGIEHLPPGGRSAGWKVFHLVGTWAKLPHELEGTDVALRKLLAHPLFSPASAAPSRDPLVGILAPPKLSCFSPTKIDLEELSLAQHADRTFKTAIDRLQGRSPQTQDVFRLKKQVLYRRNKRKSGHSWLLCVPKFLRGQVARACYVDPSSGHGGQTKTIEIILQRFWWPGATK